MAKVQVMPGQLLRHKDSSVRGYPGDIVSDADPSIAVQSDLDHVVVHVAASATLSPSPADNDATSDTQPLEIGTRP